MILKPIESPDTVVNEVLQRLTQAILQGNFKPGDKIPSEPELSKQLGVGRNSIREAVKMLMAMGVLTARRGQGTFLVDSISPAVFNPLIFYLILEPKTGEHLYELRVMFESMVLMMATRKITPDDMERIRSVAEEAKALAKDAAVTIDQMVDCDMRFHKEMLKCTHNPLIENIGTTIIAMFPTYIKKALLLEGGIGESIQMHDHILEILRNRDMSNVLETVEKTIIKSI